MNKVIRNSLAISLIVVIIFSFLLSGSEPSGPSIWLFIIGILVAYAYFLFFPIYPAVHLSKLEKSSHGFGLGMTYGALMGLGAVIISYFLAGGVPGGISGIGPYFFGGVQVIYLIIGGLVVLFSKKKIVL